MTQGKRWMVWMAGYMALIGGIGQAAELTFSLHDSYGRRVTSQDYKGVPLFLEFGACW